MTSFPDTFSTALAVASLFILTGTTLILVHMIISGRWLASAERGIARFMWLIGLYATAVMIASTLVYSEVFGYEPCHLCWYSRIALYPQIVVYAVGVWRPAIQLCITSLILSLFGALVAVYNIFVQFTPASGFICSVSGGDCSSIHSLTFGFITIPVMALIGFFFLAVLSVIGIREYARDGTVEM